MNILNGFYVFQTSKTAIESLNVLKLKKVVAEVEFEQVLKISGCTKNHQQTDAANCFGTIESHLSLFHTKLTSTINSLKSLRKVSNSCFIKIGI